MPRPKKWRKVCSLPKFSRYGPLGLSKTDNIIVMSVEEYETLRLIDYEKFNQEDCAKQMNVARTTVQGIYESARYKVAQSLVDGNTLVIQGGNYQICEGINEFCGQRCRHGRGGRNFR